MSEPAEEKQTKPQGKSGFQKYYAEHRETFLDKRRKKYANDPEYAEKQRQAARDYRQKEKARKAGKA